MKSGSISHDRWAPGNTMNTNKLLTRQTLSTDYPLDIRHSYFVLEHAMYFWTLIYIATRKNTSRLHHQWWHRWSFSTASPANNIQVNTLYPHHSCNDQQQNVSHRYPWQDYPTKSEGPRTVEGQHTSQFITAKIIIIWSYSWSQ